MKNINKAYHVLKNAKLRDDYDLNLDDDEDDDINITE